MWIEIVDPETLERKRYETWGSDSKGTQQCFIEVQGREYVLNVHPEQPEPICEKPRRWDLSAVGGQCSEVRDRLRPITTKVRHPKLL